MLLQNGDLYGGCASHNDCFVFGPVIDQYNPNETFTEVDLGARTPGTTSGKGVRFMVTGKNASSTGFGIAIDYIKFIPQ